MAIGAVKTARIAVYNQEKQIYDELIFNEPAEIVSCTGNVSQVDNDISIHAHITLGLMDGTTKGGYLTEGAVVFACELFGIALDGEQLKRYTTLLLASNCGSCKQLGVSMEKLFQRA